jgi:1A family penicillin-binding protein
MEPATASPRARLAQALRSRRRRSNGRHRVAPYLVAALLLLLLMGAVLIAAVATVGAATAAAFYVSFTEALPPVTAMGNRDFFKTTRILDRDGTLLYELFDQSYGRRTMVRLAEMPPVLVGAVLAAEDASFYANPGIEPRGILRAAWQNLRAGSVVSGGSTITQQLIRNVLLDPDERTQDTLDRKLREAFLAIELSASYSKDQILEWYLNQIYFGNLSYGIGTAARTYFNKPLRDLSLAEAALLAGLPQAPSRYDPFRSFSAAKARQEDILDLMARNGFVTTEQAEEAKQEPLQFVPAESAAVSIRYPHWVFYVRSMLEERYGPQRLLTSGLTVYTTLDSHLQDAAEDAVRRHLNVLSAQGADNASLVAIEPTTGQILAMVGSPDYYDASIHGQVNGALTLQQPGSSIKPLVYLMAFLKGMSPASVVVDGPISLPDGAGGLWTPQNFDNQFRGPVTLRRALGNSMNIPAVRVLQYANLGDTIQLARRLGMTSLADPSTYGLSFTLGGGDVRLLELATAYTVLANGGVKVPVSPILKIVDGDGKVVFQHEPTREQVVDPRAVFLVTDILSDNQARLETFGPNSPLRLANARPAAAKTGSTEDYRDAWTMGYTPSLVTGVWVGRHDNRPMRLVLGSSGAGVIWNTFMERALEGWPQEPFEPPPGLVRESGCAARDPESGECTRTTSDWVFEERSRAGLARLGSRAVAVDRVTGKLADHDTPYLDIVLRRFAASGAAAVAPKPTAYSDRTGVARPWEALTPIVVATVLPPTATTTPGPGTPRVTPVPATPSPTLTPTTTRGS